METKQTAVEFLIEHIKLDAIHKAKSIDEWVNIFQQAKAMEKEQIEKAFQMNYDYPDGMAASERYYQRNYDNGK